MNVRNSLRLSALATLLLVASGAQGTVYRCAQASGAVLYSDYPCDGASVARRFRRLKSQAPYWRERSACSPN